MYSSRSPSCPLPTIIIVLNLSSTFSSFPLPSFPVSPFAFFVDALFLVSPFLCYFLLVLFVLLRNSLVQSLSSSTSPVCTYEEIRESFNGSSQNVIPFSFTDIFQAAPSLFQTKSHKQQRTPLALEDLQALLPVTVNKLA